MMRVGSAVRWLPWLVGALCLAISVNAFASGKFALVIGNAAYRGADRLTTPAGDARLIAKRLQDMGFKVSLHTDDTRHNFVGDIDAFSRKAEGADVVVFHYAGHGFEVGSDNFLMPVDLSLPLNRLDTAALRREGVSLRSVRAALASAGARARVLLIDACRTAPDRGASARGMRKEVAGRGVVLAWSTAPGSAAVDSMRALGKPIDHSPFAWYLANDLAQTHAGIIRVLRQVQEQVSVATGDAQRPWFTSGLIGNLDLAAPAGSGTSRAPNAAQLAGVPMRGVNGNVAAGENAAARRLWDNEELAITTASRNLDAPAVQALRRRAHAGDSRAAVILGDAYAAGDSVARNPARAIRYYRQAVHAGYIPGMTHLGEALYLGRLLPRDVSAAERLFQVAAKADETRATLDLSQVRMARGDATGVADYIKGLRQVMQTTNDRSRQLQQAMQKALRQGGMVPTSAPPSSH